MATNLAARSTCTLLVAAGEVLEVSRTLSIQAVHHEKKKQNINIRRKGVTKNAKQKHG